MEERSDGDDYNRYNDKEFFEDNKVNKQIDWKRRLNRNGKERNICTLKSTRTTKRKKSRTVSKITIRTILRLEVGLDLNG